MNIFPLNKPNTGHMQTSVVEITPDMAKKYLEVNIDNQRNISDSVVDKYARDIVNGNWLITHQGLGFDTQGMMIDGQHRCHAIIKANIPVNMSITINVSPEAMDHVDINKARTAKDVYKLEGETWITKDIIATVRTYYFLHNGFRTWVVLSPFELKSLCYGLKDGLSFVFDNIERKPGITSAAIYAAFLSAYYCEQDHERLLESINIYISGQYGTDKSGTGLILFRDWMSMHGGHKLYGRTVSRVKVLKLQRAIKAFMRREVITKLFEPTSIIYKSILFQEGE